MAQKRDCHRVRAQHRYPSAKIDTGKTNHFPLRVQSLKQALLRRIEH